MAEGFPPLVLELRAKVGEFVASIKEAASETEKAAAKSKAAATDVEKSATRAAESTAAGTTRASSGWTKFMGVSKGAALGVVGAAAVVGVESIKMAGNFQAQINRLETAAGESKNNLKMVGDGVLALARATGTSTEELTSGMYMIESAGFHGAAGLAVLKAAAQGARNENADLGTVGNALTTVMNDLGAKSGDAAKLMSQMVAAVGAGKMTMDDLAGSIHTVLPNAAKLGITFPQVAGALSTMTAQGVSAEQAAQNLNHTIVKLAAPTTAMSNAMAAYGVNSDELSKSLGKNGLTGTMDILSKAILDHMGPSGTALMDTFNKSKLAAADANKMLTNLPPSIQKMAKGFLDGTVGMKEFQKAGKEMGAAGSSQVASFIKLAQTSHGFNDALKSGKADAQTFTQAMYSMLGDQTGLQVALHLTGDAAGTFNDNVKKIAGTTADANGNVKDWAVTQENFNTKMARLKQTVETAAISIGQKLLPPVSAFAGFLADHQGVLIAFAAVIGGTMVAAAAAWGAKMVWAGVQSVVNFAKMIAAGAAWVAKSTVQFATWVAQQASSIAETTALWAVYFAEWIARQATAMATAVADMASSMASWVAQQATQLAKSIAGFVVWAAEHAAMAAAFIAENVAMAASATAAFIAENAATLGIVAAIGLIVAGVVWLATHWQQAWDAIKTAAMWTYDNVIKPVGDWIMNNVLRPIGSTVSWLYNSVWKPTWDAIGSALRWGYDNVIGPVIGAITGAINGIVGAISTVIGWIQKAIGWFNDLFSSANTANAAAQRAQQANAAAKMANVNFSNSLIGNNLSAYAGGPSKDVGGWIYEAPKGQPIRMTGHGGEYVLSLDMLAGRQKIDPAVVAAIAGQQQGSPSQQALTGGGSGGTGGGQSVTVIAQTNADPNRIAKQVGWELRAMA